jgi:hypothetical protein
MRFEELLVRLEITDSVVSGCSKRLNIESSLFGPMPELDDIRRRCAHVHQVLNKAIDGLYDQSVTPRQLSNRIPNVEREVAQLELVADQIRKSLDVMSAVEC